MEVRRLEMIKGAWKGVITIHRPSFMLVTSTVNNPFQSYEVCNTPYFETEAFSDLCSQTFLSYFDEYYIPLFTFFRHFAVIAASSGFIIFMI